MPKSIIREYENSNRTLDLSANFAVFVPGLAAIEDSSLIKEAEKAGIYYRDTNIYRLNNINQFNKYIGLCKISADHTVPETAKPEKVDASSDSELINNYKWIVYSYELDTWDEAEEKFYSVVEDTTTRPATWSTTRRLYIEAKVEEADDSLVTHYYQLAEYSKEAMREYFAVDEHPKFISGLVKIKAGNEGVNIVDGEKHLGNKIAYELLNAGYTVYYKVLKNFDEEHPETTTVLAQLLDKDLWEPLKDKSTYRIRYITSGGCYNYNVYELMAKVANFNNTVELADADTLESATGRGDCIALFDIDETGFNEALNTPSKVATAFGAGAKAISAKLGTAGKYCAIFAPRVVYAGENEDFDIKYPASFNYLLCAARSQENFAEWWAAAGYTRGISYKTIEYTTYNFGDLLINTLAPRKGNNYTTVSINLILNERGNYYLWGNRTALSLETDTDNLKFSHFLNIRQLCVTLKQTIYSATRQFTFDPNSDVLWINFVNAIRPTLEKMKGDQGIAGYKISRVTTDKKAVMMAKIRIVPIEAVEDFDISVYLEDSIDGIVVNADETVAD